MRGWGHAPACRHAAAAAQPPPGSRSRSRAAAQQRRAPLGRAARGVQPRVGQRPCRGAGVAAAHPAQRVHELLAALGQREVGRHGDQHLGRARRAHARLLLVRDLVAVLVVLRAARRSDTPTASTSRTRRSLRRRAGVGSSAQRGRSRARKQRRRRRGAGLRPHALRSAPRRWLLCTGRGCGAAARSASRPKSNWWQSRTRQPRRTPET